jgi:hypothetical protein
MKKNNPEKHTPGKNNGGIKQHKEEVRVRLEVFKMNDR